MTSSPVHKQRPTYSTGVRQYKVYQSYKGNLRSDFNRRCGYCDDSDAHLGGARGFHIDHFAPRKKFGELETTYTNLVYACPFCNNHKSDYWVSNDATVSVIDDEGMLHPCDPDFSSHLARRVDGCIEWTSELGRFVYEKLKLHLMRHQIDWLLWRTEHLRNETKQLIDNSDGAKETLYRQHIALTDLIEKYRAEITDQ